MIPGIALLGRFIAAMSAFLVPATPPAPGLTIADAPFELTGDWDGMLPESVMKVLELARQSCMTGVRLVSDREPDQIRVDAHTSGNPAICLHPDQSRTAWFIIDIGDWKWIQLAYQFGHEMGHVLANSWQSHAVPALPCQWLEEALVEAFSIRGLGLLAENWRATPPFPDDSGYADSIVAYRDEWLTKFTELARTNGCLQDLGGWFRSNRESIEAFGSREDSQAAAVVILQVYEQSPGCIEALGALNRWPRRSAVGLADYLHLWEESCVELGADTTLPTRLRDMLGPV